MLRMTEQVMSDWLSPERKRIKEIMSLARKKEPSIQKSAKTFDETLIDPVDRTEQHAGVNVIFDMIGTTGNAHTYPPPEKNVPSDVIGALYEQYCRALDDPFASFAGDWNSVAQIERDSITSPEHGPDVVSHQHAESIEAVISGVRGVEHFFGKLEQGNSPPAFTLEPVPEILHLFAPPEFKAREARLPSALVRREHHAPGIDSPLFAPRLVHSEAVA
jgi:hypothetical protein